jgi:hypothetical protein
MQESHGPSHDNPYKEADEAKAKEEHEQPTVSQPGGFANDPDDPSNPNQVIERSRRKLRP